MSEMPEMKTFTVKGPAGNVTYEIVDEAARKKVAQAVSYTEQELTPEQQAQARKNIGALGATASIENGVLKVELATIKDNILIIK